MKILALVILTVLVCAFWLFVGLSLFGPRKKQESYFLIAGIIIIGAFLFHVFFI